MVLKGEWDLDRYEFTHKINGQVNKFQCSGTNVTCLKIIEKSTEIRNL